MEATQSPANLSAQMTTDLTALEKRAAFLSSKAVWVLMAGGLTCVSTIGAYLLGHWSAPSASLSAVHVPGALLSLFSAGGDPLNSFASASYVFAALDSLLTGNLFKGLAVLAFIIGSMVAVARGKLQLMFFPVFMLATSFMLPVFLGSLDGSTQDSSQGDRADFVHLASSADYAGLQGMMMKNKVPLPLQQYVLAQAMLVKSQSENKPLDPLALKQLAVEVSGVDKAVLGGWSVPVDGESMYALEKVALGTAQSKPAKNYYAEATKNSQSAEKMGRLLAAAAMTFLMAGMGLLVVGWRMRARINRIRPLLGLPGDNLI